MAAYHEARLAELIEHVAGDIQRFQAGEIDVYDADETIHHYQRAARELWKFCWGTSGSRYVELAVRTLEQMQAGGETIDWWERGASRRR